MALGLVVWPPWKRPDEPGEKPAVTPAWFVRKIFGGWRRLEPLASSGAEP